MRSILIVLFAITLSYAADFIIQPVPNQNIPLKGSSTLVQLDSTHNFFDPSKMPGAIGAFATDYTIYLEQGGRRVRITGYSWYSNATFTLTPVSPEDPNHLSPGSANLIVSVRIRVNKYDYDNYDTIEEYSQPVVLSDVPETAPTLQFERSALGDHRIFVFNSYFQIKLTHYAYDENLNVVPLIAQFSAKITNQNGQQKDYGTFYNSDGKTYLSAVVLAPASSFGEGPALVTITETKTDGTVVTYSYSVQVLSALPSYFKEPVPQQRISLDRYSVNIFLNNDYPFRSRYPDALSFQIKGMTVAFQQGSQRSVAFSGYFAPSFSVPVPQISSGNYNLTVSLLINVTLPDGESQDSTWDFAQPVVLYSLAASSSTTLGPASSSSTPSTSSNPAPSTDLPRGNCGSGFYACGRDCYSLDQYCCVNNVLTQRAYCSSSASTNPAPSSNPTPTSATPSSGSDLPRGNCGAGLYSCGNDCYSPDQYCCVNGALTQKMFCSASSAPSISGPSTSTTSGNSSPAASSSIDICGGQCSGQSCCPTPSGSQCYFSSTHSCTSDDLGNSYLCSNGLNACGGACYSPSQYKCKGGQLQQL